MKLERVEQLAVFYEPTADQRRKVGRLALKDRQILFEYDPPFLASRLELSPFRLPLRPGVTIGEPAVFDGLMGLFEDSLPDGWGRLLIDRRAAELGLSGVSLTPLDRLAVVGARSMGALSYEPEAPLEDPETIKLAELAREAHAVQHDLGDVDLERLIAAGGSPKGARPKVLIQIGRSAADGIDTARVRSLGRDGKILLGSRDIRPGFTAWMVKFPAKDDPRHIGPLEHAYMLMAKAAGIDVPRSKLLGRTTRNPGYFAIERFDRAGGRRVHVHTLGGLLHLPHGYPALDYRDLLRTTRQLTRNEAAVAEMFRRACFNVLAHNRDDHSRNFAFIMDPRGGWAPSPVYDITFSSGPGGEHTMLVGGEGRAPGRTQLLAIAEQADLRKAAPIFDEVRAAIARFRDFADRAGVPARLRNEVANTIGGAKR